MRGVGGEDAKAGLVEISEWDGPASVQAQGSVGAAERPRSVGVAGVV